MLIYSKSSGAPTKFEICDHFWSSLLFEQNNLWGVTYLFTFFMLVTHWVSKETLAVAQTDVTLVSGDTLRRPYWKMWL